jgi:transposase InsO family protein
VPWKGQTPVDLRMEFIARLKKGERVSELCTEYGISRKTGHKFKKRFEEAGAAGLFDQSRAPRHIPHRTPPEVAELVVAERVKHPDWGPKKLKDVLEKHLGHDLPSASTLGEILVRRGLITRRKIRRRHPPRPTALRPVSAANEVWCIDYKGQFRLGDGRYCYPLTVTDQFSRYILGCEAMAAIDDDQAREAMTAIFREHGLPSYMRSDNGPPFASTGLLGLTRLSVFWMRLGIIPERTRPAHPQDNGRHERMHRTLKRKTTRPPRTNLLQQQEVFDAFVLEFNTERPHEALGMKRPAEVYGPSPRTFPSVLREPSYPTHDDAVAVNSAGSIWISGRGTLYISSALAGQLVGIREEDDGRWLFTFMDLDLGHLETHTNTFRPISPLPPETSPV